MHFTLSSLAALTLSLSLASAAPSAPIRRWGPDLTVTFEGADPDTTFYVPVYLGQQTDVGQFSNGHPDLSISYISYDRQDFGCAFTAQHDGAGAANAALACTGDNCQLGPPQAVYTVTCVSCNGVPYCDQYPSL